MPDWQPDLYLQFGKERTQPSIDLVARIDLTDPKRIIDIGCGPGNSTKVLQARWPQAKIVGLDNSEAMVAEARTKYPDMTWLQAGASDDLSELGTFDLVFSNAAIQWIPDQELLLPRLFGMLNTQGILAVQVPCAKYMPLHIEQVKLAAAEKWKNRFENLTSTYSVHTAGFYYDILCNLTKEIDLWETDYYHLMDTHADLVKWSSGSALRPYLECLQDASMIAEFCSEYEEALKGVYPPQTDGKIILPFTRIFFIAKKA